MDDSWTDRIVGERMAVDREFSSRVEGSKFSSQEWSLVMTATEFEIEHPEDPERARLVSNTEQVDQILPELEKIRSQMGAMGSPAADSDSGDGVLTSLKRALGLGGGSGPRYEDEQQAAETLTQEYADQLQERLESNGRWEEVRAAAATEGSEDG